MDPLESEWTNLDMLTDRVVANSPGMHAQLIGGDRGEAVERLMGVLRLVFPNNGQLTMAYLEERCKKYAATQATLEGLKQLPVIEQKSEEWLRVRQSIVTASDFAQALGEGKFGTQLDFFKKKCGYEDVPFDANCPPLKWGVMLEDVACAIYERRNNVKIVPFGLVRHPTVDHFGASPDGITTLGVMLEIKCPYRRQITNEVPRQYFYQIQGQLEVCDLDECDFLECEFRTVTGIAELRGMAGNVREAGAIFEDPYSPDTGPGRYLYSPVCDTSKEGLAQLSEWIASNTEAIKTFTKPCIWYLEKINVIRVYRNREFINEKFKELESVWSKVVAYRGDKELYDSEIGTKAKSDLEKSCVVSSTKAKTGGTSGFVGYMFLD
jgi:putative phage-type endonuclease